MMKWLLMILVTANLQTLQAQTKNATPDKELIAKFNQLYNKAFAALELEDDKGRPFNTATLKGKTLFVDYWFTQCPPCLKEIPYAKSLQTFFAADTNIVFVNICIEYAERKQAWKEMVKQKELGGINLFYAKNRPQKINLLREYKVADYPTYTIVNKAFTIIGHNAPAPSDKGLIEWCLHAATKNIKLSDAFLLWRHNGKEVKEFYQ